MTYRIVDFSIENLRSEFSNRHVTPEFLQSHFRIKYLFGYLDELQCKKMLIEEEYVDGPYLDDYSQFYVKCFRQYERFCRRIHFFRTGFDEKNFELLIDNKLPESQVASLISSYIGYVVAKPLPQAVVGRTLLETYPPDGGRRNFPCLADFSANIYGFCLPITSLPFQEQDTVAAACATTALWSAIHKCSQLFRTECPTPATITQYATRHVLTSRPIPSHGLNVYQMCNAIREVKLEPEVFYMSGRIPLASLIYAYMRAELPVILGIDIETKGMHAITLAGYSLEKDKQREREVHPNYDGRNLKGLYISKFYAHDDQIGPFSRLEIQDGATVKVDSYEEEYPIRFKGSWKDNGRQLWMDPVVIIIPVYHKIRIKFLDVTDWIQAIDQYFTSIGMFGPDASLTLEWDVFLSTLNKFREELWGSIRNTNMGRKLLLDNHPRFIWRIQASVRGLPLFEILADATDMARSFFFYRMWFKHKDFGQYLKSKITEPGGKESIAKYLTSKFVKLVEESYCE
jgi:hypothetical protein